MYISVKKDKIKIKTRLSNMKHLYSGKKKKRKSMKLVYPYLMRKSKIFCKSSQTF